MVFGKILKEYAVKLYKRLGSLGLLFVYHNRSQMHKVVKVGWHKVQDCRVAGAMIADM